MKRPLHIPWFGGALACAWALVAVTAATREPARILVVAPPAGAAYAEAVGGLKTASREDLCEVVPLAEFEKRSAEILARIRPEVIVTVGGQALHAGLTVAGPTPVVATMVFQTGPLKGARGVVTLHAAMGGVLAQAARVLPGRVRVGVLRNPAAAPVSAEEIQALARQQGYRAEVRDCAGPDDVVKTFAAFRESVDFVWCPPDETLFKGDVIRPLVLASLRTRVPLVGFSEAFARAGAGLAIFPDYRAVGGQTADLVRRLLEGRLSGASLAPQPIFEAPRSLRIALNERMLRLMGVRYERPPDVIIVQP